MWLSLPLGESARVRLATRWVNCVAGAGLVVSLGAQRQSGFTVSSAFVLAASLTGIMLVAWAAVRIALRFGWIAPVFRGEGSTLLVDADGTAFLLPPAGGLVPLDIEHTYCALGVAWIAARGEGHRYSLLSGADRVDDGQWRRLSAWLRWRSRGAC